MSAIGTKETYWVARFLILCTIFSSINRHLLVSPKQLTERAGLPIPQDGATKAEIAEAEAEREPPSPGSGSSHALLWAMLPTWVRGESRTR